MPTTFFEWVVFLTQKYYPLLLKGAANTLVIATAGTIIGFLIGMGAAVIRAVPADKHGSAALRAGIGVIKFVLSAYVEIFRGTPMIVQAMVIYYGLVRGLQLPISTLAAAIIIISINTGAYMAEIIRGGITSVDRGQMEGAQSIGMTYPQAMFHVVLPQAVRNVIPAMGNEYITNIKDSAVLNVISVSELFFVAKGAAGTYLRYFEVFFIVGIVYLIMTFTVTRILRAVERKLDSTGPAENRTLDAAVNLEE